MDKNAPDNADRLSTAAWPRVKALFEHVRGLEFGQRSPYLEAACAGNPALRAEVESLLASAESNDAFLHPPTSPFGPSSEASSRWLGRQLGPYTLVRVVGEGGMGTVFEAVQKEPNRRVAIKVLRSSLGDQRMFQREIQALALLNHPNIARLYEVGCTDRGEQYFVMELVSGLPLGEFARHHHLSIAQRLSLFALICDGIAYAHQRGVIHRDIKPGNILVCLDDATASSDQVLAPSSGVSSETRSAIASFSCLDRMQPKILDFGLARIADSDLTVTADAGHVQGTLAYMSPEQVRGKPGEIDLRSDVYSLGVVLYELLTERLPYDVHSVTLPNALRMICDEPPRRLASKEDGAMSRALVGDLETIAQKALEKSPSQRYASVAALADDVRRHLAGRPIMARAQSFSYQLRKAVQRHKLAFSSALAIVFLLASLAVSMSLMSWRLAAQRDEARKAKDAETARLWESYLAQAQAIRLSGQRGQRFDALEVIRKAAAIRPSLELRNEAIAALANFDAQPLRVLGDGMPRDAAAFSADLTRYATRDSEDQISVREVATDRRVAVLRNHSDHILRLSRDGRYLAMIESPHNWVGDSLLVWEVDSGRVLRLTGELWIGAFDFSADGRYVATGHTSGTVTLRRVTDGADLRSFETGIPPRCLSFSRDGTRIAVTTYVSGASLEIWDVENARRLHSIELGSNAEQPCWSPDGSSIAVGLSNYNILVYDARKGTLRASLHGHTNAGIALAFDATSQVLASSAWDGEMRFWDISTARPLVSVHGGYTPCAFSADGQTLGVLRIEANDRCTQEVWRVSKPDVRYPIQHDAMEQLGTLIDSSALLDGRIWAATNDSGVDFFTMPEGEFIAHLTIGYTRTAAFHSNGEFLITSGERGVLRWPVQQIRSAAWKIGPPAPLYTEHITHCADLSGDGSTCAAHVDGSDQIVVLNPTTRSPLRFLGPHGPGWLEPVLNADGTLMAVGNWHGKSVTVWDVQRGVQLAKWELPSTTVRMTPDGSHLLTLDILGNYTIWDRASLLPLRKWQLRSPSIVSANSTSAIGPSGSTGIWRLYDPHSLAPVADLPLTMAGFNGSFVPDHGWLAISGPSRIGSTVFWDLRKLREQLAQLGLDWEAPPFPPASPAQTQRPSIEIDLGAPTEPVSDRRERNSE